MMHTVAIHQPNFLPWVGYFNKINAVNTFVFLDDVQFERGKTYTSRTKILVQGQEQWLTIPVSNKSSLVFIKDIEVNDQTNWKNKHLMTIKLNYKKAPYFDMFYPIIEKVYTSKSQFLIDYNIPLICSLSAAIGISTEFARSSEISDESLKGSAKIMDILKKTRATAYLSGSGEGSRRYIDPTDFENNGINLYWQKYDLLPYAQFKSEPFAKNLSIIDLVFHTGLSALKHL